MVPYQIIHGTLTPLRERSNPHGASTKNVNDSNNTQYYKQIKKNPGDYMNTIDVVNNSNPNQ